MEQIITKNKKILNDLEKLVGFSVKKLLITEEYIFVYDGTLTSFRADTEEEWNQGYTFQQLKEIQKEKNIKLCKYLENLFKIKTALKIKK